MPCLTDLGSDQLIKGQTLKKTSQLFSSCIMGFILALIGSPCQKHLGTPY